MSVWEPTADELVHVRRALYVLRGRLGPWSLVSKAIRVTEVNMRDIRDGSRTPTPKIIGRIAELTGVETRDMLRGALSCCPRCGYLVAMPGTPDET